MTLTNLIAAASQAHQANRLPEAADLCRQLLTDEPNHPQANLLLGVVSVKLGDLETAIRHLELVQRLDPSSFQAPFWLGIAYRKVGDRGSAIKASERAVSLNSNDPQAQAQLGLCYLDARLLTESESYLRAASRLAPDVIQIHCSLSCCLQLQGKKEEALQIVRQALDRTRLSASALMKFGQLLLSEENGLAAAEFARRALAIDPQSSAAHLLLSRSLLADNHGQEAADHLQVVVKQEPQNAEAKASLGIALQSLGRIREASDQFLDSIRTEPTQGYAYFALFHNRKVEETDRPTIAQMQSLASGEQLPMKQRSYLHFGLGKAFENLGDYEQAMAHYDEGNRIEYELKFRGRPFNQAEYSSAIDRTIQTFTKQFIADRSEMGSKSNAPIFVVGMMRSGTTLVEQILSSHPEVGAAGEQLFFPDNWRLGMNADQTDLHPQGILELANRYESVLKSAAPGYGRVVDKMPGNRSGLGIIHLTFPQAKIIHTRRHPVDTCLSVYATPNRAQIEFAHNRENIVFGYLEYLRLMEHWRAVLPSESFLEVDYEELVNDSEAATRKLIDFVGLEWSEACLRPQDNVRSVVTPSVWQVRQPIYKTSIERWRNFEPWLGAFKELLPASI